MLIVMKPQATEDEIQAVIDRIESVGGTAHPSRGEEVTLIGAIGDSDTEVRVSALELDGQPGVSKVVPILKPYKLASKEQHREASIFDIGGAKIGGDHFALIAGPCTVESRDQLLETADVVKARRREHAPRRRLQAAHLARTPSRDSARRACGCSPRPRRSAGLPIVTELMDARDLEPVLEVADVIQVGARNMQNYGLLSELGRAGRPVLLKRGLSSTLEELLMAAEYILKEGNEAVMLCERGIRTFETAYRFTLDLMAVPVLKQMTHLPIVVDPSHAAGRRDLVESLSLAAAAAGADGIIVEVHPQPEEAICDGPQALRASEFAAYAQKVEQVARIAGKLPFLQAQASAA